MPQVGAIAGLGLLGAYLAAAMLRHGPPRRRTLEERLADLPTSGLPLRAAVSIRWNEHQIPFIEAGHDSDLAVALGVVHGHLRLAQIEMMRRAAHGRLSELFGPATAELDGLLRTLDLTRAVPAIAAALPAETRAWLAGFAQGINAVIAHGPRPWELRLLGHRPAPWTVEDLLALGRVAATDFTWKVWIPLLRLRARPDWPGLWERMMRDSAVPVPGFAGADVPGAPPLGWLAALLGRHGSNSYAVSAARSATGSALIASDPHLSLVLPNLWLVAGMRSPGMHAVGLMIPGVPAVALGRNPWIAWGGTSLHAQSSELFDVGDLPPSGIRERRETIRVRWRGARAVTVRDTAWGPVVTDTPMLRNGRALALHWVGHRPSDEVTALLAANRARTWEEFRQALDGFAAPAQNMILADAGGRVGQCMAAHLPWRPPDPPADLVVPREHRAHWERMAVGSDLPARWNPERGFVASANNRPEIAGGPPVGFFFSPDDRVRRLRDLLSRPEPVSLDDLKAAQRDVFVPSAVELRDRLLALAGDAPQRGLLAVLAGWDGRYDADSAGAAAFELLLDAFVRRLRGRGGQDVYTAGWEPWAALRDDLEAMDPARIRTALRAALAATARHGHPRWGALHRLRLSHPLGMLPLLGRRFRVVDEPVGGGNETVMKTAHGFASGRHAAKFGANARHISDLGDLDANHVVLLGGQDGWLGSTTFADQVDLWRRGAYVQVPLRPETARATFRFHTELRP
ncbi:MAG TPA: penicillin acylase family protein [Azospirillum sp.]|nr:penicillin acylase family protein [Azospirillum sp.]